MKFLEEIAEHFLNQYAESDEEVTVVFPNRRAGLFFQKHLSSKVTVPVWSPRIKSIEDFIKGLSNLESGERLDLIFELYKVFTALNKSKEDFDRFYYWGNIMLQDFDEIDKFLIDAKLLFKNLAHVKDIENSLDYLEEDQKKLIAGFWSNFGDKLSSHQKGFIGIWENLYQTYIQFKNKLYEKGIAYDGMIYRDVEEELRLGQSHPEIPKVIFAGFNALSKSEESIITWFVKEGLGKVYWDADDHYLNDKGHEAGSFLRDLRSGNPELSKTFKERYGNQFIDSIKGVEVVSVASDVGQAQCASEVLSGLNAKLDENTAVVLPDSELLLPLLHSIPKGVEHLNITMGYPLISSSLYGFVDALLELQTSSENKKVYHYRSVLAILKHPVFSKFKDESVVDIEKNIIKNNSIWIPKMIFEIDNQLVKQIFKDPLTLQEYVLEIIIFLAEEIDDQIEREFLFHFYTLLNRLNEFTANHSLEISRTAFRKLFRQMAQNERLPFEGEPLLGLQIMGILETRNLDFENVIVLSMNETQMPPLPKNHSFIPYSIRKVFELPVMDHQDAIYAYIFYRLVQRAKNVYFIYNSSENNGKSGEVSRYVRQLMYETNLRIKQRTVYDEVLLEDSRGISIEKDQHTFDKLKLYTSLRNYEKRFTPTALNTYLDCSLKFYFRYVLDMAEEDDITEDVDAMVFGNILHRVMERLYLVFDTEHNRVIESKDIILLKTKLDKAIEIEFAEQFGLKGKAFKFEGQNLLAREIVKKMIIKVLDYDEQRTPFKVLGIEAGEKKGYSYNSTILIGGQSIGIGMKGIIDRIENKDGTIRIIDYKTGQDNKEFPNIPSLFDRENKSRNKAVFQTFIYGLLFLNSSSMKSDYPIQASLFNIRELFKPDFSPLIQHKKQNVQDIRTFLIEFEHDLKQLFIEIYDRNISFSQTTDLKKCGYCAYGGICNR